VADEVGRALHRFALELGVDVAFWRKCDMVLPFTVEGEWTL